MFKSTSRRLTTLNSLVFLLIFIAFTSILYGYLALRLFDKVDNAMQSQANSFNLPQGRFALAAPPPLFDPRIFLLLRSSDGRIVNPAPFRIDETDDIAKIAALATTGEIQTKEYQNHVYRMIVVPYQYENNFYNGDSGFLVQEVIAVSIVDSEVELLNNLLWITIGGGIISVISIILAGYLLAKRAMVPIRAAWEKQQQFVSEASHELRSPITGIYNNAELMLRHPKHTIEEEGHRINAIMKESKRMTKLISSLLTLARSDANKAELQLAPVNISEVIQTVVQGFEVMEEIYRVNLTWNIQPNVELLADKERLHQLMVILIDNAFKYTKAGGQVHICSFQADKNVVITVEDTGCGISSENLPHIFDRFFREDKARSRESGGIGLGLAIAKWIIEKHGGQIKVESKLGKGTKFIVSIPVIKSKES
ncbi:MAG: integral rane sensor signal transduction histidine kinase [Firmicutes bacterium]|nr:integral rane sensor signal transduction histidine kinase [Bacillota bacterium]